METKEKFLKQVIEYQRKQTPDRYLNQVHQELLGLLAHAACQKPDGSYSCQQAIHKDARILLELLTDWQIKSETTSCFFGEKVNSLIKEAIADFKS